MTPVLALKLFLVPALIGLVTLAGRRWGPSVAGWLSAFPVVSGPILLAIALEQGTPFAAVAAEGTMLAVVAILVFSLAYAWASARFGVPGSMACALGAYALAVALLQAWHPAVGLAFALVCASLIIAPRLFPAVQLTGTGTPTSGRDMPWRMLAGAALVLSVTWGAASMGPRLSGFLAMFPVMSTVLVGFSHAVSGRPFAVALLRGMVFGYVAFAVFCLVVAVVLPRASVAAAFATAFGAALTVQVLSRVVMRYFTKAVGSRALRGPAHPTSQGS